ncbi:MAG: hypothetical protein SGI72_14450 [Planctomycetota bacterium]|nr:hypothetical protein [Planctomycetota bacterium]
MDSARAKDEDAPEASGVGAERHGGLALDSLLVVDLRRTERRLLDRYWGRDGAMQFLAAHLDRLQFKSTG